MDFYKVLNHAGRILTRRRCWWWRLVAPVSLLAVNATTDIALPSDFDTLDTILLSTGLGPVRTVSPQDYTRLVAGLSTGQIPSGTVVLMPVMTYDATTGAETKVLKLLSAATTNGSPTFTMTYYRGWFDVNSANDASVAHIPPDFDHALTLIARACALDLNEQAESHEMVCYEREVAALEQADSRRTPQFGHMRGGANDRTNRIPIYGPITSIT